MKIKIQIIYIVLILSTLTIVACNSQSTKVIPKDGNQLQLKEPRVDSILQFNSIILSIFEDSKGIMWFGSWCDGMAKYDPNDRFENGKMKFTYYTVENGIPGTEIDEYNNRRVPLGNNIGGIQEDDEGNILFVTLGGVVKYDRNQFSTIPVEEKSILITEYFDETQKDPEVAWRKEFNKLWFANFLDNGAYLYDGKKIKSIIFPTKEKDKKLPWSKNAVYSLHKDRNQNIWLGTKSAGIFQYNPLDRTNDRVSFTCINEREEKGIVRAIFQDKSGRVWISNVLQGLRYYDAQAPVAGQNKLYNFTHEMGYYTLSEIRNDATLDKSKLLDGVQTIVQEEEGTLWFGTFGNGLWRYDGNVLTHFGEGKGISSNYIKSIFKDKSGKIWFAIGDDPANLYHFNGEIFERVEQAKS